MAFLNFKDTISGAEASAYATINGRNVALFYLKQLEAKVKKEKTSGRVLGNRASQHKATGWEGTGTATLYYVTSEFRQIMLDYMKKGVDTYFDIVITNHDPTSEIGSQSVVLKRCNLDEVTMALINVDNQALEEPISFTFEDMDMTESFVAPKLLG